MAPDETPPAEGDTPAGEQAAPDPAPAPAPAPAPDPLAAAEERAAKAELAHKEAHDRMLRVAADFENYKKRAKKDVEEAEARGRKAFMLAVLPVIDNLERALDAADTSGGGAAASIAEGVRLVHKQLLSSLEKFDVKALAATGQAFDPNLHEAIQQIETADHPPGTVVKELQRGYTIGGKLLRPAMVAVAKAPPAPPPQGDGKGEVAEIPVDVDTSDGGAS